MKKSNSDVKSILKHKIKMNLVKDKKHTNSNHHNYEKSLLYDANMLVIIAKDVKKISFMKKYIYHNPSEKAFKDYQNICDETLGSCLNYISITNELFHLSYLLDFVSNNIIDFTRTQRHYQNAIIFLSWCAKDVLQSLDKCGYVYDGGYVIADARKLAWHPDKYQGWKGYCNRKTGQQDWHWQMH